MIGKMEKMQLGRKKRYLEKVITVIELLNQHENHTTIRRRVFDEYIKPVILCSYQQFNNMLNEVNPYKQLEDIQAKIADVNKEKDKDLGGANIKILDNPNKEPLKVDVWDYEIGYNIE